MLSAEALTKCLFVLVEKVLSQLSGANGVGGGSGGEVDIGGGDDSGGGGDGGGGGGDGGGFDSPSFPVYNLFFLGLWVRQRIRNEGLHGSDITQTNWSLHRQDILYCFHAPVTVWLSGDTSGVDAVLFNDSLPRFRSHLGVVRIFTLRWHGSQTHATR